MTINTVILRNEVLQYAMNNHDVLPGGVLYLKNPIKHGTTEVYGCTMHGEVLAVDDDGTEINVSYNDLENSLVIDRLFVELHHDYLTKVFN